LQEVYGYRRQPVLTAMTWLFIGLTGGVLRLVFHWWPHWMLYATHKKCPLNTADKVLVVVSHVCGQINGSVLKLQTGRMVDNDKVSKDT
jgi:cation-transporting ATPase 13A3/4/5